MPTYTYRCKDCEHPFERILSISEMNTPTTEPCPECGKLNVGKTITGTSIVAGVDTKNKIPHQFKDLLREIKKDRANTNVDHLI